MASLGALDVIRVRLECPTDIESLVRAVALLGNGIGPMDMELVPIRSRCGRPHPAFVDLAPSRPIRFGHGSSIYPTKAGGTYTSPARMKAFPFQTEILSAGRMMSRFDLKLDWSLAPMLG